MLLETFKNFSDFELLDTGNGFRLEKWGEVILKRPDPQIIWQPSLPAAEWNKAHASFQTGRGEERGTWSVKKSLPKSWAVQFQDTKFSLKLSPFKHTGLFAEQAAQWEWMLSHLGGNTQKGFSLPTLPPVAASQSKVSSDRNESDSRTKIKILNLFGYTGGATMVLAKAGCFVTHVDASKPTIAWAKENHALNKLPADSVRWILDDAIKFVQREIKRGAQYDGIVMDPPAFGHGPTGKTWRFNHDLPGLLADCVKLLSPNARFLVINGYATNSSALALHHVLQDAMRTDDKHLEFGELCLSQQNKRLISTGIFARWSK